MQTPAGSTAENRKPKTENRKPGLYVHVPFCQTKCPYCDFYSVTTPGLISVYLSGLEKEALIYSSKMSAPGGTGFPACAMQAKHSWTTNVSPQKIKIPPAPLFQRGVKSPPLAKGDLGGFAPAQAKACGYPDAPWPVFDSLYLGGGTPSLLNPKQIAALLASLRRHFSFVPDTEFTLEANPDDVTPEKLRHWRDLGVNRLSLGVQSLDEAELRFLGRRHSAAQARRAMALARDAGFANLSVDLMYGLPGQTLEGWLQTLEQTLSFAPEHLSCYQLTLAAATPLGRRAARGELAPLADEAERQFFLGTAEYLAGRGYLHYEVSNFAREARHFCRHNQKYWRHVPYLGLGPGAHSFDGHKRWWNHASLAEYNAALSAGAAPVADSETLTPAQRRLEALYLGFRTRDGVSIKLLDREPRGQAALAELKRAGLVRIEEGRAVATPEGLVVADRLPLLFTA
jgi:putative oxygen-independent coproporphyrinogen III oxidase